MPLSASKRTTAEAIVVSALLIAIAFAHHQGLVKGEAKERISQVELERKLDRTKTEQAVARVGVAKKVLSVVQRRADQAAKKVTVSGDTTTIARDSAPPLEIVNSDLAARITTCDAVSRQKDLVIAQQDTVIASQHRGLIDAQNEIAILKAEKNPRFGFKTGIAVGAGALAAIVKLVALVAK